MLREGLRAFGAVQVSGEEFLVLPGVRPKTGLFALLTCAQGNGAGRMTLRKVSY